MTLNSALVKVFRRGQYINFAPVVIEVKTGRFQSVKDSLKDIADTRHLIPSFNMISAVIGNQAIEELADNHSVKMIYLDREVSLPYPSALPLQEPAIAPQIPRPLVNLGIRRPGRILTGERIQNVINTFQSIRAQRTGGAATSLFGGDTDVPEPDPGLISTSEVRRLIRADEARADGIEGEGTLAAVIDTGAPAMPMRRLHPQLSGPSVENIYLFPPLRQPERSGHGSFVISQIVGRKYTAPNGLVLEGGAPGCNVLAIKALVTRLGVGRDSDILKGMERAYELGAKIINMSLGSEGYVKDNPFEGPLAAMTARDVIFAVAAGNSGPGPGTIGTPGGSPNVFTVASVNTKGKVAGFSSRGPIGPAAKPDCASYGGDDITGEYIYSSTSMGSFGDKLDPPIANMMSKMYGTSMATPTFTSILILWDGWMRKNRGRSLSNADVLQILNSLGPHNDAVGHGVPTYSSIKGVM